MRAVRECGLEQAMDAGEIAEAIPRCSPGA